MFIVMHPVDPQGFSSIPASAWWAAQTLTTAGYGDLVPTTALGQFVAIIAMFLGIATFAIPVAIIGAGFMGAFEAQKGQRHASNDPIQLLRDLANLKEEKVITEELFEQSKRRFWSAFDSCAAPVSFAYLLRTARRAAALTGAVLLCWRCNELFRDRFQGCLPHECTMIVTITVSFVHSHLHHRSR